MCAYIYILLAQHCCYIGLRNNATAAGVKAVYNTYIALVLESFSCSHIFTERVNYLTFLLAVFKINQDYKTAAVKGPGSNSIYNAHIYV